MKKLIFTISLMLVTLVIFAQGQPQSWSGINGYNPAHHPPQSPKADDLQVLPADPLLWSQGPGCANVGSSEVMSEFGLSSNCADDFTLTSGKNITAARWWFGFWNGVYTPFSSWTVTIYNDAACLSGNIVQQWIIPFNLSHETLQCYTNYFSYWADLSPAFTAAPNTKYWISVQTGDHPFTCQWGWDMTSPVASCGGAFKSDYFGYPDYVSTTVIFGQPTDFSFELYGTDAGVPPVPISNWALFIGIGLILIAAVVRFRRLV